MDSKKELGQRINAALAMRDKKQKELAHAIGVTDNTISYFCSGKRVPNLQQIIAISKELDVSTNYLLGLSETPSIDEDIQVTCKVTGLSDNAIGFLRRAIDHHEERVLVLNALLENYDFYHLLGIIYECVNAKDPREEIFETSLGDRFPNHSSQEISEALAAHWSSKMILSTVEMLSRGGADNGKH